MQLLRIRKKIKMSTEWLKITGKLVFDVADKTNKHKAQSSWKKTAIVLFNDDVCEYYQWLLKKRFNIELNKPLRGSHYTVINDKYDNIDLWNKVKKRHDGTQIDVYYNTNLRSNVEHWWLKAYSIQGYDIRKELNLGMPFFNPHITIGLANNKNIEQSEYALRCEKLFGTVNPIEFPKEIQSYF